ncbi:DUF192 domain-containing protein [Mesorhizobium sp. CAU 1741]|uniref:DUF192 domain-containing protein n=1 Tax=Mesorhizobium sp. CAU 1741 TaxID=3140366 RepID=UPI00325A88BF
MSRFVWVLSIFLAAMSAHVTQSAFSQPAERGQPMLLPDDPHPLLVETASGTHEFTIEVAASPDQRAAGLMFRTDMADDKGMLFVFERTQRLSFWMQNTPMPLDLIFIDADGRIVAIRWGEPFSTASISSLTPARFVLELKAGTAQEAGMKEGDLVRHPRIEETAGAD